MYRDTKEALPYDVPIALGNPVVMTHYIVSNLYHDILTGISVTRILHFLYKTPIGWFFNKQATSETATYGSESVAARTFVEQVVDLRTTLRYVGARIIGSSYMFGDNESVVLSSMNFNTNYVKYTMYYVSNE